MLRDYMYNFSLGGQHTTFTFPPQTATVKRERKKKEKKKRKKFSSTPSSSRRAIPDSLLAPRFLAYMYIKSPVMIHGS